MVRLSLLDAVDRTNIRVIERRRGTRLALKTLQQIVIVRHRGREKFQRDVTTEIGVLGLVNDAHAALAEL